MSPLTIRVDADVARLKRQLGDVARKQVPFATALALTNVAKLAQTAVTRALPSVFDRPSPFTLRGVGVERATKAKPAARVFFRDRQAAYLALQETGGTRKPRKKALILPGAARTNQYGNLRRSTIAGLKNRKDTFIGTVKGQSGLWQRPKKRGEKLKLMAAFEPTARYHARLGFQIRVQGVARAAIGPALREALAQALKNAR